MRPVAIRRVEDLTPTRLVKINRTHELRRVVRAVVVLAGGADVGGGGGDGAVNFELVEEKVFSSIECQINILAMRVAWYQTIIPALTVRIDL